jgi:hypothetical protein
MAREPGARTPNITSQIVVAVFVALIAGGTAPWWWGALSAGTSTTTTTRPGAGGETDTTTTTVATTTTTDTPTTTEASGQCRGVIRNPLSILYEETDRFSQQIAQIPAGEYEVVEVETVTRINEERWLRIDVDGALGWIPDDTWTVDSRKGCSF